MITRLELTSRYPTSTACNGNGAVMVAELQSLPCVWAYSPTSLGSTERRAEFKDLLCAAMAKIGWKEDRRCRIGWRRIATKDMTTA